MGKTKDKKDEDINKENMIDFVTGARYCVCSFTNPKHIRRITELYEKRPEDFKYFYVNEDKSVCAKIPLKWIKISPPRAMSDEQKEQCRQRLNKMREEGRI